MEKIVGNVFETDDYERFGFIEGNRGLKPTLVKAITQSMLNFGWKGPAIICRIGKNGKFEIADGQHRYTAAKTVGIPVRYEIDNGINLSEIQNMNNIGKAWTNLDFIKSYCDVGNENYIYLARMIEKHPKIPMTCIAPLCCGKRTTGGINDKNYVRSGRYRFDIENADMLDKILTEMERYSDALRKVGGRTDCLHYALAFALQSDKVDWDRLYSKFMASVGTFSPVYQTEAFLKEISEAYNRSIKKGSRIHLDVDWADR